jgi:hypothetical protein
MAVHDEHTHLEGYHEDQLLHDGCAECEWRGKDPAMAIQHLDPLRFAHAWRRACMMQLHGIPNCSKAERPMLDVFAATAVQLERRGLPIGVLPQF